MNILYLHGLDGSLSDEKRSALLNHGQIFAPQIDYRASEDVFNALSEEYKNCNIDVVIGNSMGGLAAYYISLLYNTPCLIFNPALAYSSIIQNIPKHVPIRNKFLQVVLGKQDDIIKANDNLKFLDENINQDFEYSTHLHNHLGHHIPIDTFEDELSFFFHKINKV